MGQLSPFLHRPFPSTNPDDVDEHLGHFQSRRSVPSFRILFTSFPATMRSLHDLFRGPPKFLELLYLHPLFQLSSRVSETSLMYSANEFNCLDRMQRLVKTEITLSYQEGGICVALNRSIYTYYILVACLGIVL